MNIYWGRGRCYSTCPFFLSAVDIPSWARRHRVSDWRQFFLLLHPTPILCLSPPPSLYLPHALGHLNSSKTSHETQRLPLETPPWNDKCWLLPFNRNTERERNHPDSHLPHQKQRDLYFDEVGYSSVRRLTFMSDVWKLSYIQATFSDLCKLAIHEKSFLVET